MGKYLEHYPEFVTSRTKNLDTGNENLLHPAVGISGEAGELLDAIKKVWIYNKATDVENIVEELGDILFYIQMMANIFDTTIEDLIEENVRKLEKRYPTGYSDKDAVARADKK